MIIHRECCTLNYKQTQSAAAVRTLVLQTLEGVPANRASKSSAAVAILNSLENVKGTKRCSERFQHNTPTAINIPINRTHCGRFLQRKHVIRYHLRILDVLNFQFVLCRTDAMNLEMTHRPTTSWLRNHRARTWKFMGISP